MHEMVGLANCETGSYARKSRRGAPVEKKLRDSCDACANSKVKCEKSRPICRRCEKKKIPCHYSPARKVGKHGTAFVTPLLDFSNPDTDQIRDRKSAGGVEALGIVNQDGEVERLSIDASSGSGLEAETATFDQSTYYQLINFQEEKISISGDCGNQTFIDQNSVSECRLPLTDVRHPIHKDSIDWSIWNEISPVDGDLSVQMNMDLHPLVSIQASTPMPSSPCMAPYSLTNGYHIINKHSSDNNQHQDCVNLAISTLKSLHVPAKSCTSYQLSTSSAVLQARTVDCVLRDNKIALNVIQTILSCPCSLKAPLALFCTLVASKILDWYQEISCSQRTNISSCAIDSTPTSAENSGTSTPFYVRGSLPGDGIADLPISIGAYSLDSVDKRKIITQLILSELAKVGKCIEVFAKRYCAKQREMAGMSVGMGSAMDAEELYLSLMEHLRARLRATMRDISDDL